MAHILKIDFFLKGDNSCLNGAAMVNWRLTSAAIFFFQIQIPKYKL